MLPFGTISAQPNKNGNDGTVGRFGWKAQNKSLMVFSGEACNVEMGISNDLFPTERDESPECQQARTPNSVTNLMAHQGNGSEANGVIAQFQHLADTDQQDLLNVLRSL